MSITLPLPGSCCPGCSASLDGMVYANEADQLPKHGDVGVCEYCTAFFVYSGDALKPRLIPAAEYWQLSDAERAALQSQRRTFERLNVLRMRK